MSTEEAKKIDELFSALMADVHSACELWHDRTDDFSRRTYVKSAMSTIEGTIQVIKQGALLFDKLNDPPVLTKEETFFLNEQEFHLENNGKIKIKKAKISLLTNFKFAIYTLAKVYNIPIDLGSFKYYKEFQMSIKLRDRITHPKKVDDLLISTSEIENFEKGMKFFRETTSVVLHNKSNLYMPPH